MSELKSKVTAGLKWSGLSQVTQQAVQFAIYVALARLLSPREFGLIGMIIVLTGFADIFVEMGLGSALVQKQDVQERHRNSIFWTNVVLGLALMFIFILLSGIISAFYKEPQLKFITMCLSFNFFLSSLGIIHWNLLLKNMDFRSIFIVNTTSTLLSGLVAITLAIFGFGVWCLVVQSVMVNILSMLLLWHFSPWRPSFQFDRHALKEIISFSANMLGFNVTNFLINNTDKLLIGRLTGSQQLGIYSRAYQLMVLPINQISGIMTRVMFPALSVIQENKEKVKEVYLRSTRIIALVTFPLMMGFVILARPFTLSLLGPKWVDIVPILQVFCLAGIGQSIGTTTGWLYTSQGRTDIMFKWSLCAGAIRISSMIIGLRWGIVGVAAAYVISGYTLLTYPGWSIAGKLVNMRFGEMLLNLRKPFFCAIIMSAVIFSMSLAIPSSWNSWFQLGVLTIIGFTSYIFLIHFYKIEGYVELRSFIVQELKNTFINKRSFSR